MFRLRSQFTYRLVLLAVVTLAFVLRVFRLPDANIWWDEGLAVWAARQNPVEIARWTSADVHPPLYFWLLHGWRLLVGDSEFAVRAFSVGVGTLTVVGVWVLGRVLLPGSQWVPGVAALFVAASRFLVWWSQETRMYMLGGLLATLSLYFMVRLRWRPTRGALAGYLLATIAALWTLYLLAFLLIIEGLYWLWMVREFVTWRERGTALLRWAVLQATVLLAFAPWLLYAVPRMRSWSVQAPFEPGLYLELYATLLTLGISTNVEAYRWPVLLVLGMLIVALVMQGVRRSNGNRAALLLLGLALTIPPLIVWGVTMLPRSFGYLPKPEARYLLPFAPSFGLLLAWGVRQFKMQNAKLKMDGARITALSQRHKGHKARPQRVYSSLFGNVLLVGLLGVSAWSLGDYYEGRYRADEYRSIGMTLAAHVQAGDAVVLHTDDSWPVFAYHWPRDWVGTPHLQEADPGGAEYFLAPLWESHAALWLVVNEDALRVDAERHFETWLAARAAAQHEWRFGARRLLLFARTPERAERLLALAPGWQPDSVRTLATQQLALVGWEQPLGRVRAGDVAHLAATVDRQGAGGGLEVWLEVWLDGLPETRTEVIVPYGVGPVRLSLSVPVPPEAGSGTYGWHVRLNEQEGDAGRVYIIGGEDMPLVREVSPEVPVQVTWGSPAMVRLVGYDLDGSQQGPLKLTLYWEGLRTPPLSYKVFTHLVNAEGRVVAQRDDFPAQGTRPTTTWRPDEIVVDTYTIPLGPDVLPGTYTLIVGFYDAATGTRLAPVLDEAGRVQPNDQMPLEDVSLGGPSNAVTDRQGPSGD